MKRQFCLLPFIQNNSMEYNDISTKPKRTANGNWIPNFVANLVLTHYTARNKGNLRAIKYTKRICSIDVPSFSILSNNYLKGRADQCKYYPTSQKQFNYQPNKWQRKRSNLKGKKLYLYTGDGKGKKITHTLMQGIICKCHPWRIPLPVVLQTDILYAHKMEDYFLFAVFFLFTHCSSAKMPFTHPTAKASLCIRTHNYKHDLKMNGPMVNPFYLGNEKKKNKETVCRLLVRIIFNLALIRFE